jgi:hypothetical protein
VSQENQRIPTARPQQEINLPGQSYEVKFLFSFEKRDVPDRDLASGQEKGVVARRPWQY